MNLFIAYKLDAWSLDLKVNFALKDYLFGAVKLTKNHDQDKISYFGQGLDETMLNIPLLLKGQNSFFV